MAKKVIITAEHHREYMVLKAKQNEMYHQSVRIRMMMDLLASRLTPTELAEIDKQLVRIVDG